MKKFILVISFLIIACLIAIAFLLFKNKSQTKKTTNTPHEYPYEFKKYFIKSCKIGEENCLCVLEYLQEKYTYEEFLKDKDNNDQGLRSAASYCKNKAINKK